MREGRSEGEHAGLLALQNAWNESRDTGDDPEDQREVKRGQRILPGGETSRNSVSAHLSGARLPGGWGEAFFREVRLPGIPIRMRCEFLTL